MLRGCLTACLQSSKILYHNIPPEGVGLKHTAWKPTKIASRIATLFKSSDFAKVEHRLYRRAKQVFCWVVRLHTNTEQSHSLKYHVQYNCEDGFVFPDYEQWIMMHMKHKNNGPTSWALGTEFGTVDCWLRLEDIIVPKFAKIRSTGTMQNNF